MTAPDDLIRRGDAERSAISYHPADGSCCHEDPTGHHAAVWACDGIAERIRALPADPVAEAAGKLADHEVRDGPWKLISGKVLCRYCYAPSDGDGHAPECLWETYRAAVAARAKEGES